MQIHSIEIYRDGGSIEFVIDKRSVPRRIVVLETPFRGEPRAVKINSVQVNRKSPELKDLVRDIDRWWEKLPTDIKKTVTRVKAHKGPHFNPEPHISEAQDLCRVLFVREYVRDTYEV